MTKVKEYTNIKFTMLLLCGLVMGLSACSTTSTVKLSEAAPVTYKVGEGSSSYASLRMAERKTLTPRTAPYGAPSPLTTPSPLSTPSPLTTPTPRYAEQNSSRHIDLSNIDRELYDHMKVGKPYKVAGKKYYPAHNPDYDKKGVASWYGDKFHGKPTANGEIYNKNAMTAAHKTLPLNSFVWVTHLDTGKSVKVRLNDRGPFVDDRIIDLSEAAAKALDIQNKGLGRVRIQYAGAASIADKGPLYKDLDSNHMAEVRKAAPVLPKMNPRPKSEIKPELNFNPNSVKPSVKSPQPRQDYKPLREIDGQADPQPDYVAAPSPKTFNFPNMMESSPSLGIALPEVDNTEAYNMPPIPSPESENTDDNIVTLTIKGPVHMAKSGDDVNNVRLENKAVDFIPAFYETE